MGQKTRFFYGGGAGGGGGSGAAEARAFALHGQLRVRGLCKIDTHVHMRVCMHTCVDRTGGLHARTCRPTRCLRARGRVHVCHQHAQHTKKMRPTDDSKFLCTLDDSEGVLCR